MTPENIIAEELVDEPEILFEVIGRAGVVTLNRPKALNALTFGMIKALQIQLRQWETDPAVRHVIVKGAGERAFCAGGDIRQLREWLVADDSIWREFYAHEYRLNDYIKRYPKPYVALIDGIVMGGGVGVSVHGSHRVATEKIRFAMPEVGIGLFPDVGGSYFLPRIINNVGTYLAMTGDVIRLADAIWTGIATHAVGSGHVDAVLNDLTTTDDIDRTLAVHASEPGPTPLEAMAEQIAPIFGGSDVAEFLEVLDQVPGPHSEWAQKTAAAMRTKSPMSLAVTCRQLQEGAKLDFRACMAMEYRMVCRILQDNNFAEGVRAVIVDKDNKPDWRPAAIRDISQADVDAHFRAPADGDMTFEA